MDTRSFWAAVDAQLAEARAARSADDVMRIFAPERDPYKLEDTGHSHGGAPGFFAGGGGDDTLRDALYEAGWTLVWSKAWYHYSMRAPDGSAITYVEGDLYRGTSQ